MNRAPKIHPLALAVAGPVVVLAGVGVAAWCVQQGHTFSAFVAICTMLGALVPLYPPDEEPTKFL
jgi:hypothetical protein